MAWQPGIAPDPALRLRIIMMTLPFYAKNIVKRDVVSLITRM
jgi:hypothetical protein